VESEQLSRLRASLRAWNAGRFEEVLEFARPDVVWRIEPFFPDMEDAYEGHEGLRRFFVTFTEAWEESSVEITRVIDERPGQILVATKFRARARDGLGVEGDFHQVYRYDENHQLREFHGFVDERKALREAGVEPG
jgi:ketosteroid isomerase-like protein